MRSTRVLCPSSFEATLLSSSNDAVLPDVVVSARLCFRPGIGFTVNAPSVCAAPAGSLPMSRSMITSRSPMQIAELLRS